MATNLTTMLHQYCQQAVAILGLPTTVPISHQDIHHAYTVKIRSVHETAACEALLLVQLLAYDYVNAAGWEHISAAPPVFEDTAELAPITPLPLEIDEAPYLQP